MDGFLSGDQARNFFLQSGLPPPILGQVFQSTIEQSTIIIVIDLESGRH